MKGSYRVYINRYKKKLDSYAKLNYLTTMALNELSNSARIVLL